MSQADELFLEQYQKELMYLREAGSQFAKEYPKIARRLEWDGEESKDPHVERLIESFAFIASKLQRTIEDRFPIIGQALLSTIYPQLTTPVPSMTMACFSQENSKSPPGYDIPKGLQLSIASKDNVACIFQTGFDIKLWPIVIQDAQVCVKDGLKLPDNIITSSHVLKLHLTSKGTTFDQMQGILKKLPVYLSGDPVLVAALYDSIFFAGERILAQDLKGNNTHIFPLQSLQNVGFSREEEIIPGTTKGHAAYRLLQEFFAFPQKFMFFSLENMILSGIENDLILYIPLTHKISEYSSSVSKDNFLLNCVPVVNIFKKTTEPLRIDYKTTEYRLIADNNREKTTEIHSIEKVSGILGNEKVKTELPFYFSYNFETLQDPKQMYWYATRKKAKLSDRPGGDMWINFVDFNFRPYLPATDIVWAEAWCTNRFAAQQIPAGGRLTPKEPLPVGKIIILNAPTAQFMPSETGEAAWRLNSALNLNHLSIAELDRFKNLLMLYAPAENAWVFKAIQGIVSITSTSKVRRITNEAWRGFVQGVGVEITLDEREFVGSSMHLFCDILSHFLGLYVSFNSFVEISLKTNKQETIIKKWSPLCGYQRLL